MLLRDYVGHHRDGDYYYKHGDRWRTWRWRRGHGNNNHHQINQSWWFKDADDIESDDGDYPPQPQLHDQEHGGQIPRKAGLGGSHAEEVDVSIWKILQRPQPTQIIWVIPQSNQIIWVIPQATQIIWVISEASARKQSKLITDLIAGMSSTLLMSQLLQKPW